MNDLQISDSLRALERVKASPAFTSNVMRAIDSPPQRRSTWSAAIAVAAAASLTLVVTATVNYQVEKSRLEALRAERQSIEAELQNVKRIAEEVEPVVVLENDHGTQLVLDLDSTPQRVSMVTYD